MKKLQQNRGETLVEVLASILIASLSVALLFGCVMASSGMDRQAAELDGKHYEALTGVETQSAAKTTGINVTITASPGDQSAELEIEIYGSPETGMFSYSRKVDP